MYTSRYIGIFFPSKRIDIYHQVVQEICDAQSFKKSAHKIKTLEGYFKSQNKFCNITRPQIQVSCNPVLVLLLTLAEMMEDTNYLLGPFLLLYYWFTVCKEL